MQAEKMTVDGRTFVRVLRVPRNMPYEAKKGATVLRENQVPYRSKMWYTVGGWYRYFYVPEGVGAKARRLLKEELWHKNRENWF